ncbi:hypothetical protein PhCBS80983_g01383 [Powellomyces hirtus]|uniref:Uncharacterized protein n=1 Tax=Powellomyces hirtus TaxID=109895 RepID=A0A507ED58_9FUNG|nr:hypothetical protein PhCBS80983_g01383 [Powellomyces hirtus]
MTRPEHRPDPHQSRSQSTSINLRPPLPPPPGRQKDHHHSKWESPMQHQHRATPSTHSKGSSSRSSFRNSLDGESYRPPRANRLSLSASPVPDFLCPPDKSTPAPLPSSGGDQTELTYIHGHYEEVGARALRKLTKPPRIQCVAPAPGRPALEDHRAASAPVLQRKSSNDQTHPPPLAGPLAPYMRRGRSSSGASMTSSEDEHADSSNPNSIFKLKHSDDRLQTQIRIIETIDQLKHTATLATTRLAGMKGTVAEAMEARFAYARYLVENVRHLEMGQKEHLDEGLQMLKTLSREAHADAQFTYASLLITGVPGTHTRHRPDYEQAFPLYLSAGKRGHADACYHAALCYEHGRGTNAPPDPVQAVKKYRKAAIQHHPGAMYRLAMVLANGELGQPRNMTASVKWLNLSARFATAKHPHALYQLALLHEHDPAALNGHVDGERAFELLRRAAELGHVPSQVRLGHLYQFGELGAAIDPESSIRYYSLAAQKGSAEAMYELSAWHFTGAEDPVHHTVILPPNDQEAYIWARKAAEKGLPQAEYAVGFYTESAIGVPRDMDEALCWYTIAATHGDDHAVARLKGSDPTSPADPSILAAVADVGDPVEGHDGKIRREGFNRLYTVRAYKRVKNQIVERRNLRKAGGL